MSSEDSLHFQARGTSHWPPEEYAILIVERLRVAPYLANLNQGYHFLSSAPTPFHLAYIALNL